MRVNFGKRHASTANLNPNGVRDSSVVDEGEALVIPRRVPRIEVASKFNSNVSGTSPLNNNRRLGTIADT